jgi:aryl-alcohol dehydrogenase-like predicted oxidoreductase
VVAPIVGTRRVQHVEDAAAAVEIELSEDEINRIEAPYHPIPVVDIK